MFRRKDGSMATRFDGKVAVVTGGGAGIGHAIAARLASEGAAIVIADVDLVVGEAAAEQFRRDGASARAVEMDVTEGAAASAMAASVTEDLGGIDVLVNNAGVHLGHAQLPYTLESLPRWRHVLEVNVLGAFTCAIACREAMRIRGGGAIVNVSSMAAYSGTGAYGVSKLALNAMTTSLANELAADGTRVNGVAPTLVDSPAAMARMQEPERIGTPDALMRGQLIKRLGRMVDVAAVAAFLWSDDASFVTGQTLLVDGGHTRKPW
jgi:3-oxoacyl-[acyl-carrier protein] reductase